MSLMNSSRIYRHSLDVFQENRKLLAFPLLSAATWLAIIVFFLMPEAQAGGADLWNWLWHPREHQDAVQAAINARPHLQDLPILLLAGSYLSGMFITTFINAAFYSQALSAMNGGSVSLTRGFSIAMEKLPAIAAWALFASTVGVILKCIENWLSIAGQFVTTLLGVGWSAASQFVIPIMLREPKPQYPLEYLRISARVLRPVWGDGLSLGRIGPAFAAGIWAMCAMVVSAVAALITHTYAPLIWGFLLVLVIVVLAGAVTVIFRCGLYIFATEGVAPGPFDTDSFNRAWTVR